MRILLSVLFLAGTIGQAQQNVPGLRTINDLFDIQIAPLRTYFQDIARIRMKILKEPHNYWFNFDTNRTGEPFFRILITREVSENKIEESVEYFVNTMFAAKLVLIREGPDLSPISDTDLIAAKYPYPGREDRYILASSILGFEILVEKTSTGRQALFSYSNNSVKYSVTEEIGETKKAYRYSAKIFDVLVQLRPQIELELVDGEWDALYFLPPRRDPVTPKTFQPSLDGLLGFNLQFNCLFYPKIIEMKWPVTNPLSCKGASVSYPINP